MTSLFWKNDNIQEQANVALSNQAWICLFVLGLNAAHLLSIHLEWKFHGGTLSSDDQLIVDVVVMFTVSTLTSSECRNGNLCKICGHYTTNSRLTRLWIGGRKCLIALLQFAFENEFFAVERPRDNSIKREFDWFASDQLVATIDVPFVLDMFSQRRRQGYWG